MSAQAQLPTYSEAEPEATTTLNSNPTFIKHIPAEALDAAAETSTTRNSNKPQTELLLDFSSLPTEQEDNDSDSDSDVEIPCYFSPPPPTTTPTMLSPRSIAALSRLRSFKPPPFPLWNTLPASRRAAVLILLFADRAGELRVVLTMRSANLRSFSGHAAFPGGKADDLSETEFQIARREAWEEIGLPMDDGGLPEGMRVEELCCLPFNLAMTELVVRPCVAFLHAPEVREEKGGRSSAGAGADAWKTKAAADWGNVNGGAERTLLPKLDAKEVAAVFSAPFYNFLLAEDEDARPVEQGAGLGSGSGKVQKKTPLPPGKWYEGSWAYWHEDRWRMHFFYVPVNNQRVTKPSADGTSAVSLKPDPLTNHHDATSAEQEQQQRPALPNGSADADPEDESRKANVVHVAESEAHRGRYKVWGMTARMLVDAATIAYATEPEFENNAHFGDEKIIMGLEMMGRLGEKKKGGQGVSTLTGEDLRRAKMVGEKGESGRGGEKGRI